MESEYDRAYEEYEWEGVWGSFEGSEDGTYNIGHEMVGKHGDREDLAVRIVDFETDDSEEITYAELHDLSSQFAHFLEEEGHSRGDVVGGLLSPRSELYATLAGTWLGGFVYMPMFTLFGPEAINYRLTDSQASVVVTSSDHREKIDESIESLETIVIVDGHDDELTFEDVRDHETEYETADTETDDLAVIQYTSGTTGSPKGAKATHRGMVAQHAYVTYAADMREGDTYFGAAPPAWSYGLFVCTAYPLHLGIGTTTFRGEFDPEMFVGVLRDYGVTNLFAIPTALRAMAGLGLELDPDAFDLRVVCTAGEPLDSNTVEWGRAAFGVDVLDHYGFTEGGMLVCNYPFSDWEVKPGSMGKPLPGRDMAILDLDEDTPVEQGEIGEIAARQGTEPNAMAEYLGLPEQSKAKFGGEWLRSDDLARVDEDGYYWYEGRADDVIISAGYRIGPTEVEDSLMGHEVVAEATVVGLPDDERGEVVAGFVIPTEDAEPSDQLAEEIKTSVRDRLSKHEYPRSIQFMEEFPRTPSGKVQRFKLREKG
jgi:acetyl-CoA synthetase